MVYNLLGTCPGQNSLNGHSPISVVTHPHQNESISSLPHFPFTIVELTFTVHAFPHKNFWLTPSKHWSHGKMVSEVADASGHSTVVAVSIVNNFENI